MDLDEEIKSREEGEVGSESRDKRDLLPCSSPLSTEVHQHGGTILGSLKLICAKYFDKYLKFGKMYRL